MNEISKFQSAKKTRTEYVNRLSESGIRLSRTSSQVIYMTEQRKIVGIPCAVETQRPPQGGWWLGLPNRHFDFVILLCQRDTEMPLDFVLPVTFFSMIWDSLYWEYLSSGWQVQFDVRRREDEFELKLKGKRRGIAKIQGFLGHVEILAE
jgi:hypothetical protein